MRRLATKLGMTVGLVTATLAACNQSHESAAPSPQAATYTPTPTPNPIAGCSKKPATVPSAPTTTGTAAATGTAQAASLDLGLDGSNGGYGGSNAGYGSGSSAPTSSVSVSWVTVQPIIQNNCIGSCHQHDNFLQYATAAQSAAQMVAYTALSPNSQNFMPPGGPALSQADQQTLALWDSEGTPQGAAAAPAAAGTATATATATGAGGNPLTLPTEPPPTTAAGCG